MTPAYIVTLVLRKSGARDAKALAAFDRKFRKQIAIRSLPSTFKGGSYLIAGNAETFDPVSALVFSQVQERAKFFENEEAASKASFHSWMPIGL